MYALLCDQCGNGRDCLDCGTTPARTLVSLCETCAFARESLCAGCGRQFASILAVRCDRCAPLGTPHTCLRCGRLDYHRPAHPLGGYQ